MDILIKPLVTEKMNIQGTALNRYGFVVDKKANKLQIKKAVEDLYSVTVADVNTLRYGGKNKTRYTKTGFLKGRTSSYKKAYVTLTDGEKIDFFSNI